MTFSPSPELLEAWDRVGAGRADAAQSAAALASLLGERPLAQPSRLVLAGDWHGDWRWARARMEQAAEAGASTLVVLGDFGLWPRNEAFLDSISRLACALELTLLWLDGNHEDFAQLERYPLVEIPDAEGRAVLLRPLRPRLWHLPRGTRWRWSSMTWAALGGAVSLDRAVRTAGADWWPQESLTPAELSAVAEGGPVDVLLTHDCPSLVEHHFPPPPSFWAPVDLVASNIHREALSAALEHLRPRVLYHGHLHRGYQRELEAPWDAKLLVVGLDCNGSRFAHTVVLDPASPADPELLG